MKIVVVGDTLVSSDYMENQAERLFPGHDKKIVKFDWEMKTKEEFQEVILDLEKNGPEARTLSEEITNELKDADILMVHFAPVSKATLDKAVNLKLIGTCRGGVEHIDIEAATEKNIPVLHVIRNAEPVAEFTLGLIYSECRNITRSHVSIINGGWRKSFPNSRYVTTLSELQVGLLGMGYIGKIVAGKLIKLGIKVKAHDPFINKEDLEKDGLGDIELVPLEDLFRNSDIISLHIRLTDETRNFVNMGLLSLMKESAYLINTARAGILDEKALVEVLAKKKIAGAAIDVFWEEPIPENHPILKLDNVTLTTHIAGDTVDAIPKAPKLLVNEMNEFFNNGKLDMIINRKTAENFKL